MWGLGKHFYRLSFYIPAMAVREQKQKQCCSRFVAKDRVCQKEEGVSDCGAARKQPLAPLQIL